jgi:hypothetical protein
MHHHEHDYTGNHNKSPAVQKGLSAAFNMHNK